MSKGNLTIIASLILIAVVAMGVGVGTMAWLNDTETAQVTATAATKDLQIAIGDDSGPTGSWHSGTTLTINGPTNWDDEETFTFIIWFRNVGTGGALYLYREYGGFSGNNGFKAAVELESMYEYLNTAWDGTNWVQVAGYGWDTTKDNSNNDGTYTLGELLDQEHNQYDEKCYNYPSVSGGVPTADYLPPNDGGRVAAKFTFKLMGSATTIALQGQTFSFTITCHMTDENISTFPGPVP